MLTHGTVVVTGGGKAKSIAYGIASSFAERGMDVVVTGRSKGRLAEARELERTGVSVLPLKVDACDPHEVVCAVERVVAEFGRIDVLVNCSQAAKAGTPLVRLGEQDLDLAFDTGLRAAFTWMRCCHPHLAKTRGSVVNLVSYAALMGQAGQSCLAVSREGLRALSRIAATEWEADGIDVNCLCALARTAQLERLQQEFPEDYDQVAAAVPGGGFAPIDEVGRSCVDLACSGRTGQTVLVSGAGVSVLHAAGFDGLDSGVTAPRTGSAGFPERTSRT